MIPIDEPIVTAEKLIAYKRAFGHLAEFKAPETVLVCYQRTTMDYILKEHPEIRPSGAVSHFYLMPDSSVGILGDWGVGAPGLAVKVEELIAHGARRFVAIGTAGALLDRHGISDFIICPKALAEDGVAHLYLPPGQTFAAAGEALYSEWGEFAKEKSLPAFHEASAWSFSALFRETLADVKRVSQMGCSVVEMESATLYAIGQMKGVQTLSLFVISDSISEEEWTPRFREPAIKNNLYRLADWALEFCSAALAENP